MKTVLKGLMAAGLVAALVASPAAAQQRSWGLGVHGAYTKFGNLAQGQATASGDNSNTYLQLDNKRTIGFSLEVWPGMGRWGLRANADKTNAPWILENHDLEPSVQPSADRTMLDNAGKNVDVWFGDANLMLRLLPTAVDRVFSPFISIGAGFGRWDQQGATPGKEQLDLRVQSADVQIFGNAQTEVVATGSIGTDLFLTHNLALRLEGKDYWNPRSPYIRLSELAATSGNRHQVGGHNFVLSAGLNLMFGRPEEKPGFIAEAPAPEPAPVVVEAPAPPPPTTETVAMCYIDQNGRLQTVSATRNLSNRNVYVMQNGQDVLFTTAYPTTEPYYIKTASWYMASRPVILDLGNGTTITTDIDVNTVPNRIEFVNFGAAQPMMSSDLMFVGSINGTPLYARSSDVGAFQTDLEAAMRTSSDLARMLADKAFADRYVNEIQTFYLPVEPGTECVFQPVSSTHVVRRTRG